MDLKIKETLKVVFNNGYFKKCNGDIFKSLSLAMKDDIINAKDAWLSYDAVYNLTELNKDFIVFVKSKTGVEISPKDSFAIQVRIYLDWLNRDAILEEYLFKQLNL